MTLDVPPDPAGLLLDADLVVPLVDGRTVRSVHLDSAASAPCLASVADAVQAFLPWSSSVHRGSGYASTVATRALEAARQSVASFVGARPDDHVVFTRNTTDALNVLARALPSDTTVLGFPSEHHANLLPWRRHRHRSLGFPSSPGDAVGRVRDAAADAAASGPVLVVVTGASNVTGERWPVAEIVEAAHASGARVVLDAAQLAPHAPIDIASLGVDHVALSGHKLYAPFGAGALVGRSDWLDRAEPYLAGGGAVRAVSVDSVEWTTGPSRHEAGTPNVVGAVALAAAADTLTAIGWPAITRAEQRHRAAIVDGLTSLRSARIHRLWPDDGPAVGVVAFTLDGLPPGLVAAALGAEHGIAVRHGSFCAHPLVDHLVDDPGGAVRVSVGIGTNADDIERLLGALDDLERHGPRWSYVADGAGFRPDPDPRPWPEASPTSHLAAAS